MRHNLLRARAPMTRRPRRIGLAALALAGLLVACSDDDDANAGSDRDLSAEQEAEFERESEVAECMRDQGIEGFPDPQVSGDGFMLVGVPWEADADDWNKAARACQPDSDEATGPGETAAAGWEKVVPGGDCECADGSEFAFFERRADPTKVVFFLDGGGSCFDAKSCAFVPESYDWEVNDNPAEEGGMFDFARADNPFADYSFVYVPLCTGDWHLGDVTREYSPELTVEHNGFVNGTAALGYLAEHYPDAAQVVVVGKSVSVAPPVYGGLVADRLPDTQVTVFGASSGGYPDDPDLNAVWNELWGVSDNMPDWEVNEGLTTRDWRPTQFWIQTGLHDPEIVLARIDYAFDKEVTSDLESLGLDASNLVAAIDANEAAIEVAGIVQHSYTAPGDGHGILEYEAFYETEVNGVRLVDWVDALLAGEPPDDVHCDECDG